MVGGWTRWIAIQCLLILYLDLGTHVVALLADKPTSDRCGLDTCWDPGRYDGGRYREEINQLWEMVKGMQKARMFKNGGPGSFDFTTLDSTLTNSTLFMVDNNLADTTGTQAAGMSRLLRSMTQLLGFAIPSDGDYNPGNIVFFDEDRSWYCEGYTCLGKCEMYQLIQDTPAPTARVTADSYIQGGCRSGGHATGVEIEEGGNDGDPPMTSSCSLYNSNPMVISLVNNPVKGPDGEDCDNDKSDFSNSYQNMINEMDNNFGFDEDGIGNEIHTDNNFCEALFNKRVMVDLMPKSRRSRYRVKRRMTADAEKFATPWNTYNGISQFTYSEDLQRAVDGMVECFHSECGCDDETNLPPPGQCYEFKENGERIETYSSP